MPPYLGAYLAQFLTSDFRRRVLHSRAELKRRLTGAPRELVYFHQVRDPYSHLMVQVLPDILQRFGLALRPFVIGDIPTDMVPEPDMLEAYGPPDAAALAQLYGLSFPKGAQRATSQEAAALGAHLAAIADKDPGRFCAEAFATGQAYWSAQKSRAAAPEASWSDKGDQALRRLGHYLPGTLWYGGEWFWGLDRLEHLEARLLSQNLGQGPVQFTKTHHGVFDPTVERPEASRAPLEVFFSARSPYSYICLFQARRFADAMGLDLVLRPVLPMVMRNMKVPFSKRLYIITDAKREATKCDLPFGKIADPIGRGVERVYAVAHWLKRSDPNRLDMFFLSAMKGIFAEGIDVATGKGLQTVVSRAGLSWPDAASALSDTSWHAWVQDNQEQLTKLGLWGVPTLRLGDISTWGQDRFWLIRQHLEQAER